MKEVCLLFWRGQGERDRKVKRQEERKTERERFAPKPRYASVPTETS